MPASISATTALPTTAASACPMLEVSEAVPLTRIPLPNGRATSIFMKVKGFLWVDDAAQQLARVEGEVTDDISLGLFLAKINKGSRFMQDRYEVAPGLWLPTFSQYDFDGRKFFSSFSVHEKTFYSDYKRIGSPAEAIPQIKTELAKLEATKAAATAIR